MMVFDSFDAWVKEHLARIEQQLRLTLNSIVYPSDVLNDALSYVVCAPSKRLRPLLVYASGVACGVDASVLDLAAQAVELLHTYSLIHDDLPAMDDAQLRRGKVVCHRVFGEDIAILIGDALQGLAYQLLSSQAQMLDSAAQVKMVHLLSVAGGLGGMIGGQVLDVLSNDTVTPSSDNLFTMYQLKTGALITASVHLGAIAGQHDERSAAWLALARYAHCLAIAFQIYDDLLDILGQQTVVGKDVGRDQVHGKITYPALVGVNAARDKIVILLDEARQALGVFDAAGCYLSGILDYVITQIVL